MKRLTQDDFEQRTWDKFGDTFDLSRTVFSGRKKPITIGCSKHGWFETTPNNLWKSKYGCSKCSPVGKRTLKDFIKLSIDKFGDIYDFSRAVYNGRKEMITIGCPVHGFMEYKADYFIESKGGCGLCGYESKRIGTEQFKNDIVEKFGDIFDLSRLDYTARDTKVKIGCSVHGWQNITPQMLMKNKYGCGECGHEAKTFTTLEWESMAEEIHDYAYSYPEGDYYNGADTKITIYCKKHDHYFEQTPYHHVNRKQGCPLYHNSRGEEAVGKWLNSRDIIFTPQKTYSDCADKALLRYDFYLPKYNVLIEYNGEQHYNKLGGFFTDALLGIKRRDKIKFDYCRDNNIPLLIIRYDEDVDTVLDNYFS